MQLRSTVRVSKPMAEGGRLKICRHHAQAIWDTGAVTSGISRRLAEKLKLEVLERSLLGTIGGNVPVFKDLVLLDLLLDDTVIPVMAAVVDDIPGEGNDFLIGMDVIRYGTLTIVSAPIEGYFHVSFKPCPGIFETVEQIFKKK